MTQYLYLLERSSEVANEFLPVRIYADEKLADEVARKNNINTRGILWAVQEIEFVE